MNLVIICSILERNSQADIFQLILAETAHSEQCKLGSQSRLGSRFLRDWVDAIFSFCKTRTDTVPLGLSQLARTLE